jgi:PAS domain S-box-containing protein
MMYAPIRSAGAVVGLISVQSYRLGVYTHDDLALLQALADHCGDALQRIKMTEALREAEAKYRAIVEHDRRLQKAILNNISDPAWLKDAQGRFLACNDALSRMLGREISEILGRSAGELRLPEAHRLASEDTEVIRARKPTRFELEQPGPEGRRKWFETIISPLSGGQGEINGTVGIARDITLRKILEEELRHLPRRIMAVQEAERLRVSRDLHDGVNQLLASVQMRLRRVQETLPEKPAAREILARCHDLLTRALEENRRIAHDLRPSELDQLGLAAACRHLCKELALRTKLSVRCLIRGLPERLTPEIELNLFRIVQEALNNVEKHANASRVVLSMMLRGGFILIRVKDDGKGFDPIRAQAAGGKTRGIGLTNIAERAAAIGGACEVESSLRHGSIIAVRVPWK